MTTNHALPCLPAVNFDPEILTLKLAAGDGRKTKASAAPPVRGWPKLQKNIG